MLKTRIIPSLLLKDSGLVKTVRFKNPRYVGDPINAIKIFNEKEVDELVILDISATRRGMIDFDLLGRLNKEAFMPLGYGGGIKKPDDAKRILGIGFEKVIIDSAAIDTPQIIDNLASECGSQSVVVCMDTVSDLLGHRWVFDYRTGKPTKQKAEDWVCECESRGAGEIILYSKDRDGTYTGYDVFALKRICELVSIPVIALGGASCIKDFFPAITAGASAVAAGSMFVFYGPFHAVLITYPDKRILDKEMRSLTT